MKKISLFAITLGLCLLIGLGTVNTVAQTSETYSWRNVAIVGGGFVPGIIYNEGESGLVYARTDIGGAYRLDTSTNRWVPLTDWVGWDEWGWTGIVSLATDAVDPNRLYLAAGTYTNEWDPNNGAILRSTDRGNTFQVSPLPFKLGGNMPGRGMGERLAIDPNNNSILYFGTPSGNGLWRSTDYGVSWSKVTSFPNPGTYAEDPNDPNNYLTDIQGIVWVTFDPRTGSPGNTTQTIYVGVADTVTFETVYCSNNGGATWAAVPGQPTAFACPHKGKLDPVNGYLYVAYSDNGGPYGGSSGDLWRNNTANGVWTRISPWPSDKPDDPAYFGYSGLAIDRQHPSTIMVTGYSSWWPDTQIWRSLDSGNTWTRIWDWTRYPNRSFRYTQDISAAPWLYWGGPPGGGRPGAEVYPKLGWMTESLEIDPFNSNKMMYGTGATIYGSDNLTVWDTGGQITITVKAIGLEETAIQEIVSPPAGPQLLSGMYDIYGFTHQNVDVVPTAFFENPRIATVSIDYAELNPSYIFRVGQGSAADGLKAAGYSTNGGTSWTAVMKQPTGVDQGQGTCAVNANGTRVVWSPTDAGLHYTTNSGGAWTACSGIPAGALVESDRVNANKFYGFLNGTFYVSTDGGASFTATVTTGLPANALFKAAPGQEGHLWLAGYNTGIWRSTDSGASFTNLSNVEEADNIGFGKAAPGQTYVSLYSSAKVGGVRGVYRSDDQGATWVRLTDAQHQFAWTGKTITGDPRVYGRVYLATNGRGIIHGDIAGGSGNMPPAVSITSPSNGATFTEGDNITITANATDSDGSVTQVEFFIGSNSLGIDTNSPYSVVWNNVAAGSYSLTAVATDDGDATTTSSPVSITVNPSGGGCTASAWDPNATYNQNDVVSYNGHEWRWKPGSPGNAEPGTSPKWQDLGACATGKIAAATESLPTTFALFQNHPNPFNPETEIRYQLPEAGKVELQIYDIAGRHIKTLVNDDQPAGFYSVRWNALDESARHVPSGFYIYRIKVVTSTKAFSESRKMLLVK